uniref:Uncharacterized protein n=1 Tax=Candidatus Kentrum sp. SD TaxID=2126332 RepID=A0A451BIJ7_9GAMM|nr:MAG: hypothetical protein BECKSD772D_GA0070982_100623 [Candidatus Kentron sp. SD]
MPNSTYKSRLLFHSSIKSIAEREAFGLMFFFDKIEIHGQPGYCINMGIGGQLQPRRGNNLFISRSALQMDLVLTILYWRGIMVHWSEEKPR